MKKETPQPVPGLEPAAFGRRRFAITLFSTALLAVSGCGFKLRGQVEIPPELNPMFIQARHGSQVRNAIVQQLQGAQVQLAESPQIARVLLRISKESHTSRVTAVDRNNKVLAREIHYGVTFDAVAPDGKQLIPKQTIDVVRGYEDPDVEVLGKQLEADLLYSDMVTDAAIRILNRLRATLI